MWQRTLEAILDSAVDAIITIDQSGIIETVNPATESLFGYTAAELKGQNISRLMPSPYKDEHDGYLQNYLATGVRKIIGIGREVVGLKKNGTTFPIHLAVSEVKLDDRIVFAGFIRDLSDFKQMQKQLLMNERLAAIGQMVSGLAHESRNAFQRSHACLAELALDLDEMPESLALVSKVQKALDDVHFLLEEVRCYAAPIILERRNCCLESLVRETWQHILDTKTSEQPPKFEVDKQTGFPEKCLIDSTRIEQVVRNLLENAFFASREPKGVLVRLRFDASREPSHNPTIRIEVIDNGTGIAESDRETIFAPFYTTKTKGTGLGLAVARRYVNAHEGRIYAKTAENGGACIVVELPFCERRPSRSNARETAH